MKVVENKKIGTERNSRKRVEELMYHLTDQPLTVLLTTADTHTCFFLNAFDCCIGKPWHFSSDPRDVWRVYFMVGREDISPLLNSLHLLQMLMSCLVIAELVCYNSYTLLSVIPVIPTSAARVRTHSAVISTLSWAFLSERLVRMFGVIIVKLMLFTLVCRSISSYFSANT